MPPQQPVFVVVAHADDWQIFAGPAIYELLADPGKSVTFILLTAGDAGDEPYHWMSRHSGAMLSILRGLPFWSPYRFGDFPPAPRACGFSVSYERAEINGKTVLTSTIAGEGDLTTRVYSLHLRDGGLLGEGFAPSFESLQRLRRGDAPMRTLWPEDGLSEYVSWDDLIATLKCTIEVACANYEGPIAVYAPDPDTRSNPGDHSDHVLTGIAVQELARLVPTIEPVWIAMYCVQHFPENLDEAQRCLQRAAIHAYGGGYMAMASLATPSWRHGWEGEYRCFGGRQYLRDER